jgi:hypothetical protein
LWANESHSLRARAGASVTFSAAGLDGPTTWTVRLRIIDSDGAATTDTATINVLNVAPTADATGPYSLLAGGRIVLSATGSDAAGVADPLTFTWDLDGDGVFGETGSAAARGDEVGPTPTFAAAGPQTVTVRCALRRDDRHGDGERAAVAGCGSTRRATATAADRAGVPEVEQGRAVPRGDEPGDGADDGSPAVRAAGGVLIQVVDVDGDNVEDVVVLFRRQSGPMRVIGGDGRVLATLPPGAFRKLLQSGPVSLEVGDRGGRKTLTLWGKVAGKWTSLVFDAATGRRLG